MAIQLKNNAVSYLATAINASDASAILQAGTGSVFPVLGPGDYFYATLQDVANNSEIVKVTARSGDLLTISRAQEGTTAKPFAAGSRIELRITAQSVLDVAAGVTASQVSVTPYGWIGATDVQAAVQEVVDDLGSSAGTSLVGFVQAGTGAVPYDARAKLRQTFSVKDFGAKGDGTTDDYAAVKAACAALQAAGGGTLVFPKGTYFINQHRIDGGPNANGITNFSFSNINGLVIDGNGSKLVMQGGWTRTADYTTSGFTYSYQNCIGFDFTTCYNVTIRNLELDGGAATVTKVAAAEGPSHGLRFAGCYHVALENLYVHHYCADGMYIVSSGPVSDFKVSRYFNVVNCKFNNNARQGCSIIQLRWATFIDCEFSYTGQAGIYGGHSPQAGVDIEPNLVHDNPTPPLNIQGDESTGDITFIGCGFVDNNGFEFVGSTRDSVQHPVQFFGCSFKNTNNNNPHVVPAMRRTLFYSCTFDDVAWYPGYGHNDDNTSEFYGCTLNWNRSTGYTILNGQPNPTLVVEDCVINFNGTSPNTGYKLYIQSPKTYFRNNRIFTAGTLHNGSTLYVIHLIQQVAESVGNRWTTDLTTAGKFFTISYDAARFVDDYIVTPTYMSPATHVVGRNNVSFGVKGFEYLESAAAGNKIRYGSAAPTTGTWKRGDKVINTAPSATGVAEWICTAAGTPGTWVASYVNYNSSERIQEVITPYISGAYTNATVSFQSSSANGSVFLEVDISGYNGGGRVLLARYGAAAVTVVQNTASYELTYNSGFAGGISVNIAFNLVNPMVRAKAMAGGVASNDFAQNLAITVS